MFGIGSPCYLSPPPNISKHQFYDFKEFPMTIFDFLQLSGDRLSRPPQESNRGISSLFLEGDRAVVLETIEPDHLGRISYQGTHWFACSVNDIYIPEQTIVKVLDRRGTTWIVQPIG